MRLDFIKPLIPYIPEVKSPTRAPSVKDKFVWTGIVLFLFFVMYHVVPFGVELRSNASLEFLQVVLASKMGTLLTIGIGPIVLASIILQLFAGAKIIDMDLQNPADKAIFTSTQKVLAIFIALAEAALFVIPGGYLTPAQSLLALGLPAGILVFVAILQIAGASVLLLYMDEVTSKYGIGSGISIFIAAGVSLAIVQGSLSLLFGGRGVPMDITVISKLTQGGATAIPSAMIALLPMVFTLLIMVVSIYAEGVKVEIPLTVDRIRVRSMYPLKLLYVSVLPVILASALLMNVQIIAKPIFLNADWQVGGVNIAHYIAYVNPSNGAIADGLLYFLTPFGNPLYTGYETYLQMLTMPTPIFQIPQIIHILVYLLVYVAICVFFGKFWIEAAGMGPETIAGQITQAGLSRPGFRTDPRIIQSMLERYIPTVAVIGSIFVGFLAVFADLTGAIGTGTGILLTVSIIYKFYEDFERQNIFESHPMLNALFGSRS